MLSIYTQRGRQPEILPTNGIERKTWWIEVRKDAEASVNDTAGGQSHLSIIQNIQY